MLRPYDLLENVLSDIETGIREDVSLNSLAAQYDLSEGHLRRVFKFAFGQSLADYIRSRKLAVSLEDLLNTDLKILDIAFDYGFGYEQTYIRAFKSEFGITPGDFRKSGHIVKVKPPLHLFDENKLTDGLFFGPDIVMVPQFNIVGKLQHMSFSESVTLAPEAGKSFWSTERTKIKSAVNRDVYIGMTFNIDTELGFSDYMPAIQVKNFKGIPQGLSEYTFEASLCARFRYIGQHHYFELSSNTASSMYEAIWKFKQSEQSRYNLLIEDAHFERIDTSLYDGTYCQMEWFAPVIKKNQGYIEELEIERKNSFSIEKNNRNDRKSSFFVFEW